MTSEQTIQLLSVLTLISNIAIAGLFILFLLNRFGYAAKVWSDLIKLISPNLIRLSLVFALVATSGSLYLSEVAGFQPCKLCWLQRIFMYPLPIILGAALWKKKKDVWLYALPLAGIGLIIAIYHYNLQISPEQLAPCTTVGFSASCSDRFFTHFGYITIPWMSLSAFLLVTMGMILLRNKYLSKK